MIIFIYNDVNYHYEVIESILNKYKDIIGRSIINPQFYMRISSDQSFQKYFIQKYPFVKFETPSKFDVSINCTVYDKHYDLLEKNSSANFYIAHEITPRLKELTNVFFLTSLGGKRSIIANVLPYAETRRKTSIPIYVIQGNLNQNRRNLNLLIKLLKKEFQYKFILKLIGKGVLPTELAPYSDKITLRPNLNFTDFHLEFVDAYCILPLITKLTHPHYYSTKLTSSVNYASGYGLKCLIDRDLQNIYKLSNVEIFNDETDIIDAFENTLNEFYHMRSM